ncbi:metalloproteinase inhibitor 3-like [Acanthaster planci]|uniref:Metalloproteinase inhibitor 3-like n=1 Tax=Acanthaster planci TaxID=133434 RepID=A0A8B7Z1Z1_ACAPL|nr:metalloproteinase inhibitor 3-like [Acanthaster planci]
MEPKLALNCLLLTLLILILEMNVGRACVCMPMHPQQHFCRSDFVIKGKILPDLKVFPDNNTKMKPDNDTSNPNVRMYTVRVEKVFKGQELMGPKKHAEILVSRRGETCGMPLQENEVYILTGQQVKNMFTINMCDWVPKYSQLTRKQRQGIRHLYKQYCDSCEIKPCFHGNCQATTPNTCIWNVSGHMLNNNDLDCESDHSRCIKDGAGCKWYMPQTMKICMKVRLQMRHNRLP